MKVKEPGGVYEIVSPSGKRYIGSAAVFSVRWAQHRALLRKGISPALQAAWNKYGEDAMIFRVLAVVEGGRDERLAREQYYIDLNIGYNVNRFARSREGTPHRAEVRTQISVTNRTAWGERSRTAPQATRIHALSMASHERA